MVDRAVIGPVPAPGLHVMTLNIRRPVEGRRRRRADRWSYRRSSVEALLRAERPTVLGLQEALPTQVSTVGQALGPGYRYIGRGHGRDGRGEGCPLYFDHERLELVDWTQEALSDRPEEAGSRSWGNLVPRVMVCGSFRDRATGARLFVVNTHLDHLSRGARARGAGAIRRRVAGQQSPAIVMGDLNAREGSRPVRELLRGDALIDAWVAASERLTPEWGTFPNYRRPSLGRPRIDWIAVSSGVEVERAAINARRFDGRWPSDHLPVQAVVRLGADLTGQPVRGRAGA